MKHLCIACVLALALGSCAAVKMPPTPYHKLHAQVTSLNRAQGKTVRVHFALQWPPGNKSPMPYLDSIHAIASGAMEGTGIGQLEARPYVDEGGNANYYGSVTLTLKSKRQGTVYLNLFDYDDDLVASTTVEIDKTAHLARKEKS